MSESTVKLAPVPDWADALIDKADTRIRAIDLPDQAVISGNLAAFGAATGLDPQGAGALGLVTSESYTIRLARDRLLAVGPLPDNVRDGWNEAGFALTRTGGADQVFELSGDGLPVLLSRATTLEDTGPSPSALVTFAHFRATLYAHERNDLLRLHVERGLAAHVWTWIEAALES